MLGYSAAWSSLSPLLVSPLVWQAQRGWVDVSCFSKEEQCWRRSSPWRRACCQPQRQAREPCASFSQPSSQRGWWSRSFWTLWRSPPLSLFSGRREDAPSCALPGLCRWRCLERVQDELQSRTQIFTIGRVRRKKDNVVDVVEGDDWNRVNRLLSAPFKARWPGTRGARKSTWKSESGKKWKREESESGKGHCARSCS